MHHHEKHITGGYERFASSGNSLFLSVFLLQALPGHAKEMFSIICPGQHLVSKHEECQPGFDLSSYLYEVLQNFETKRQNPK